MMQKNNNKLNLIRYKNNFIKTVIIRADFINELKDIAEELPPEFTRKISSRFPIDEPNKVLAGELKVSGKQVSTKHAEITIWRFFDKIRTKLLTIQPKFIVLELYKYTTYEMLRDDIQLIFESALESFPYITTSRLGLRYINEIKTESKNPLDWSDYIQKNLLHLFKYKEDRNYLSRLMHNMEYNFDNFNLRFLYGIANPAYPARITQNLFVLDFDAYIHASILREEVLNHFDSFHGKIQKNFERVITDKLREVMNG